MGRLLVTEMSLPSGSGRGSSVKVQVLSPAPPKKQIPNEVSAFFAWRNRQASLWFGHARNRSGFLSFASCIFMLFLLILSCFRHLLYHGYVRFSFFPLNRDKVLRVRQRGTGQRNGWSTKKLRLRSGGKTGQRKRRNSDRIQ